MSNKFSKIKIKLETNSLSFITFILDLFNVYKHNIQSNLMYKKPLRGFKFSCDNSSLWRVFFFFFYHAHILLVLALVRIMGNLAHLVIKIFDVFVLLNKIVQRVICVFHIFDFFHIVIDLIKQF